MVVERLRLLGLSLLLSEGGAGHGRKEGDLLDLNTT